MEWQPILTVPKKQEWQPILSVPKPQPNPGLSLPSISTTSQTSTPAVIAPSQNRVNDTVRGLAAPFAGPAKTVAAVAQSAGTLSVNPILDRMRQNLAHQGERVNALTGEPQNMNYVPGKGPLMVPRSTFALASGFTGHGAPKKIDGITPAPQPTPGTPASPAPSVRPPVQPPKSPQSPLISKPKSDIPSSADTNISPPNRNSFNKAVAEGSARAPDPGVFRKTATNLKTGLTNFLEYTQNTQERVRQLTNRKDLNITDTSNPYQAATLFSGRVGAKMEAAMQRADDIAAETTTLARTFRSDQGTMRKQLNDYLHAQHAPERNAALGDGAAGLKTDEALDIVKNTPKELQPVAKKALELNRESLDLLKDSGVITPELHTTLTTKYKNHVPLQRVFEGDDFESVLSGRGFDVRSTGIQSAKGSQREVRDIVGNILYNHEQAVLRAEKNIVDQATLKFVRDNQEALKDVAVIRNPKAIGQSFDGKVLRERTDDPKVLQMFEAGKPVWIEFKDERLAAAFRGTNKAKLGPILNFVGSFTRLYSGLATRFNPEFALPNKFRDIQEAAIYVASEEGFGSAAKMVGRNTVKLGLNDTKPVLDYLRGIDSPGAKLYKEMKDMGGTTGGFGLSTRKQVEVNVAKIFKTARSKPRQAAQSLLSAVDSWNTIFEDSTRFTVYKQALDNGASKEHAAFLAKEASINFNRSGTAGPVINALWMFSNASIQGTTKLLRSMANPKVAMTVATAVTASVTAVNEWNDRVDPDWREKITTWDRLNGLPVMLPGDDGARYFTIPVSWGVKPMMVAANYAYDASTGAEVELKDMASHLFTSVVEAANPMGGTDAVSAAVPTILDMPVEIARNQAWSGAPIKPDRDPNAPADVQYFDSLEETTTGRTAIAGTKKLQETTGIAISPADINYAFEQLVGGAGRALKKSSNTLWGISTGEPPPADEFPFVSRFYKERTADEVGRGTGAQQELNKIQQEDSRENFYEKKQAEAIWTDLKGKPVEEIKSRLMQLKEDDETLFKRVVDVGQADKLGLSGIEKDLKTSTVDVRARYFLEEINKLKTLDEKKAYLQPFKDKKILTEDVIKRMKEMKTGQPPPEEQASEGFNPLAAARDFVMPKTAQAAKLDMPLPFTDKRLPIIETKKVDRGLIDKAVSYLSGEGPSVTFDHSLPKTAQAASVASVPKTEKPLPSGYTPREIVDAIAMNETSIVKGDKYKFRKPSGDPKLGDDLGKYQVTEEFLRLYGKRYLGRKVTAEEFINNPQLQEDFMTNRVIYLTNQGYTPEQIADIHRHGSTFEPGSTKYKRSQYVQKFSTTLKSKKSTPQ